MRNPIINDNGIIHHYTVAEAFGPEDQEVSTGDFVAFSCEGETVVGRVTSISSDLVELVDMDGDKDIYCVGLIQGEVILLGRRSR